MAGFYVRDELGRFAENAVGPAARSFEGYFQEILTRPATPSGHFLAVVDGEPRQVFVEGGFVNLVLGTSGALHASVFPVVVTATSSLPTGTIGVGAPSTATPSVVTATANVPTPTVTAGSAASAAPIVVTASASVPAPTVATSQNISPSVITAAAVVPLPAVVAGDIVSFTVLAEGGKLDSSTPSTIDTPSVSPSADKLQLLLVCTSRQTTTNPATPTVSGNGLTWDIVANSLFDPSGVSRGRMTLYRAATASPTTGVATITPGWTLAADDNITYHWIEVTNVVATSNGADGIDQVVSAPGTTDPPIATLAAFADVDNATLGFLAIRDDAPAPTPGSGFTQLGSHVAASGRSLSSLAEYQLTNDTTVDFGATGMTVVNGWGVIALELIKAP
jgi:hypothetical protein